MLGISLEKFGFYEILNLVSKYQNQEFNENI